MSWSLVEDVQAVSSLKQLGLTVPDLTCHFLYVLGELRNFLLYLERRQKPYKSEKPSQIGQARFFRKVL